MQNRQRIRLWRNNRTTWLLVGSRLSVFHCQLAARRDDAVPACEVLKHPASLETPSLLQQSARRARLVRSDLQEQEATQSQAPGRRRNDFPVKAETVRSPVQGPSRLPL